MERAKIEKELRRNRSTLAVVGLGVIAFGAWSVVKTVLILTLRAGDPLENSEFAEGAFSEIAHIIFYAFIVLVLLLDLALRLYVGLSARKEGLRGKKSAKYIVLACLLAAMSVYSSIFTAGTIGEMSKPKDAAASTVEDAFNLRKGEGVEDAVVSTLVEVTSTVTLIQLIVAGVRVKQLEKLAAEQEA